MRVVGITMVRDEADIIAGTLRHMAGEVDHLVVADNLSTDGTREILHELASDLSMTLLDNEDPAHYQGRKLTILAELAVTQFGGADWIVPFDADEIWSARNPRIRDLLALMPDTDVVAAALYDHHRTGQDVDDPDPVRAMVWRKADPSPLPKVAFRWRPGAVIHDGNHGVDLPGGGVVAAVSLLEVHHFPARSAAQWTRKGMQGGAALALTDLPEDTGKHWRDYARLAESFGPDVLAEVYANHWTFPDPIAAGLVRDPAPYMRWRTDATT